MWYGNLTPEAKKTMYIKTQEWKGLGSVSSSAAERVTLLLDPRDKLCYEKACWGGGEAIRVQFMKYAREDIAETLVSSGNSELATPGSREKNDE